MDSNKGKLTPTQDPIGGGSSSVGGGGVATMNSMDWRTQLHPDARGNMVKAITQLLLKIVAPEPEDIRDKVEELAIRFEKRVYTSDETTSKSDYINKISEKIHTLFPKTPGNNNESPYADMNKVIKLED